MITTLKLLLPIMIPSWRFFDEIAPSPRIEYCLLATPQAKPQDWHIFRPRPAHLSVKTMFKRMLWNPDWNDTLFTASCAERLMANPESFDHSAQEITTRIQHDLADQSEKTPYFIFRLRFTYRAEDGEIKQVTTYQSDIEQVIV